MARRKGEDGQSGGKATRLAARCGFLCVPPIVASFLGLDWYQLGFCVWAALIWSALEASIVFRMGVSLGCKRVPFVLRLIVSCVLDVQVVWLLGMQAPDGSPAAPSAIDGVGMGSAADSSVSGGVALRGSADAIVTVDDGHIPGQDAWWLKEGDLPPPPPAKTVSSISVVLPCANETDFVANTVRSVFEATPEEELLEILVIDDASRPAISRLIGEEELGKHKARILRHDNAEGLIRSKKHGGDLSRGDVIIFLDCHVKPAQGWTKQIMSLLQENNKRVVVPGITSLNPDTWQEVSPFGGASKMCMTWDADFQWCNGYPGMYVPIMSGGLLALSRYWWHEIGGYDEDMHAWGGENLDQSLRTWLCGGEIVAAQESRVAHMWRDANNPKTRLHYSIPTDDVRRNRLRAVQGWLGPWTEKVRGFPQFDDFKQGGRLNVGSFESYEYHQKKLRCQPFEWYINRFKDYYEGAGVLPDKVFNLRETSTGMCLHASVSTKGKPEKFVLQPCNPRSEQQRVHYANMQRGKHGKCCSGVKLWEFDACVMVHKLKSDLLSTMCDQFGNNGGQHFSLIDGQLRWKENQGCVTTRDLNTQEKLRARAGANFSAHKNDLLKFAQCAAPEGQRPKVGQGYSRQDHRESDDSFQLVAEGTGGLCLGWTKRNNVKALALEPCGAGEDVRWKLAALWGQHQLKNVGQDQCVDAHDLQDPILYPCYALGSNRKQLFTLHENGWIEIPRTWNDNGRNRWPAKCFDAEPVEPIGLQLEHCHKVEESNTRWEIAHDEVPMETRLWNERKGKF